jgi:geranylgeranyl diphosphate synthase type I
MTDRVPSSLSGIARRVDRRLDDLLRAEIDRWSELDPSLSGPIGEVRDLVMAGGKRLRPAFCHWGFVGAGGDPEDPRIVDAGGAFELMHAFALFHDDVMDDAESRRGKTTVHMRYADQHRIKNWAGESRRFGEGVAILVGDLAFVYADLLLEQAPPAVWRIWNELRIELNIGQFLDVAGGVERVRDVVRAERICRYKSGKYTIERPLHLGAVLALPEPSSHRNMLIAGLSAYGLPLGDAFQMRDDVMGAFGDEALTGKPVGGDLIEGKPTPLLARATAAADTAQRQILDLVGRDDLSPAQVADIQEVIIATGALGALEAQIAALTDQAIAALEPLDLAGDARAELVALADYVSQRQS